MNLPQLLPILIPLAVVAIVMLRARKPRRVDINRLWIMPALVTVLIGMGLYYQPHPVFGLAQYAVFALALAIGTAAGLARAHSMRIARDPVTGHVMVQASPLALLLIVALLGIRMGLRTATGVAGAGWVAALIDASMLLALAMVISQRIWLWRRIGTHAALA